MDRKLEQCLAGELGNYILPFFWQHGESHEALLEELEAIYRTGIRSFCVESRPYEKFGSEQWYEDFGFLLAQAKKRDMKVWLLDDKLFPTGYANGYLKDPSLAHLRKQMIREDHMDLCGPVTDVAVLANRAEEGEELLAVVAMRRSGVGEEVCGEPVDLTAQVRDGLVWATLPEGMWRVFFLIGTPYMHQKLEERFDYYIDMLSPESCKSMIHAVYQPHYDRFSEYFGNTFMGFFSDEPCFNNAMGSYETMLGKKVHFPWRPELLPLLAEACGVSQQQMWSLLPALWYQTGENTALVRTAYMDTITKMYRDNFSNMLGNWCREHGVMYIGHIIEDMNTHMRMGYGPGHFFRALEGQDMGGIDVVLHQLLPGNREMVNAAPVSGGLTDPEFFRYLLAKMGASAAHLEPRKKGRVMCEIYGAFGWAEGLPFMKYLTDHMLACGINHYVPHAFSPKYPDPDCPPHFYARGNNPQYPLFGRLMTYMQRVCHLLSEGTHAADAAVFYNAEGEWSGSDYQLFQKAAKHLTQHQLDFDVVPADLLAPEHCRVEDGKLWINGVSFKSLVVSYSKVLPLGLLERFADLAKQGLPVIFTDALPERACPATDLSGMLPLFEAVPLARLADTLRAKHPGDITPDRPCPALRAIHFTRPDGGHLYLFFNEDTVQPLVCNLTLSHGGEGCFYDPWDNQAFRARNPEGKLSLSLPAAGFAAVLFGGDLSALPELPRFPDAFRPLSLENWTVTCRERDTDPWQEPPEPIPCPGNLSAVLPRFSGEVRYTAEFTAGSAADFALLDLGKVGETAEVWLNGQYLGAKISAPYQFPAKGLQPGRNTLEVRVVNNPAYRERDYFSRWMILPPSGLMGPVTVG